MRGFGKKELVVVGGLYTPWTETNAYYSGVTAAGLVDAGLRVPGTPVAGMSTLQSQTALNNWASAVGCGDPVFPLALDNDYGRDTTGAAALFQIWANETEQPAPPLAEDGRVGSSTWAWLGDFASAAPAPPAPSPSPSPVGPGPVVVVPPGVPDAPWSTGKKVFVGGAIGLAILGAIYVAHEYA